MRPPPPWLEEQRTYVALARLVQLLLQERDVERAPWPPAMLIMREDLVVELPWTPPCRHLSPHELRPIESESELVNYLVFKQLGWERAGYCWAYVPAFLHEWFGCGPEQTLFARS